MSSRAAVISTLALGLALIGVLTVRADLAGSSKVDFSMEPIPCTLVGEIKLDTPCEKTLIKFDIESLIIVNLTLEQASLSLNSAVGIAGVEHLVIIGNATLGMLEVISEFWLAAPFEFVLDVNLMPNTVIIPPGKMLFVKKRLTMTISNGGVTVKNLALFEDVTFPNPGASYGETDCDGDGNPEGSCVGGVETNPADSYQTQSFAFGDLITLTGQTPSGVTVTGQLGICATNAGNAIKKFSASGSVNPECASQIKPDLLFDFMSLAISGIPLAVGVNGSANISCVKVTKCSFTNVISLSGGPIPLSTSLIFSDLFTISFSGVNIRLDYGAILVNVNINNKFEFSSVSLSFSQTLGSGDLSARLSGNANFTKGTGLTGASLNLAVTRGTFNANHALMLVRDPISGALKFGSLAIAMGFNLSPALVSLKVAFGAAGLSQAGFSVGLIF